jgi:hypothetical protein
MKTIILSFFTLFSLFVDIQEKTKNIGFSNGILEMSLCWIFFYFYYKKERKIKSKSFMVVSVIFSVCMLIGNSFASTGDFTLLYRTPMHFGLQLCRFVGYIFFFKTGLSYVYTYLKKYKKSFPYQRGIKLFDEHPFLFPCICLFLSYLIYMIAFYPAILSPDPSNQIKQFFNIETKYLDSVIVTNPNVYLTNHHPVFHTMLLGGCTKIGLLLGSFNLGLFIYTLLQTLTVIFTLSYTIFFMKKINTPYRIRCFFLLFYMFCPIFPLYAMSTVKDTFFSCCIVLYTIQVFVLLQNKDYQKHQFLFLFLIILFLILFRNNGIHVFLLSFPFLFFLLKKIWKKNLLLFLLCLACNFGYTKVLLPAFDIPEGSIREMLSIPFQQTARYVTKYENEITEKEKEAIDKILVYNTLKERYDPTISDPVKSEFNKYATEEDLKDYFGVWLGQFFKHPLVYLEATVANTYGYFYPNTTSWYVYYKYDDRLSSAGFDYRYNQLEDLRNTLSKYANTYKKIPLIGLSVNIGFSFFVLMTLFIYVFYEKKYNDLLIFVPHFVLLFVCVASPVNTYFRYAMPYVFALPILFCITLFILKEKDR